MPYPNQKAINSFSKQEIKRLYIVAAVMSAIAGYINSAMLLEYAIPVSQMSGVASHLSTEMFEMDIHFLLLTLAVLLSFIFGAFLSGLLIGNKNYSETPNYAYGLILNGFLIITAGLLNPLQSFITVVLTAVACGLQNALVASYKGVQLRTTHMTGNATDLGVHLAKRIRTGTKWSWQSQLLLILLISYVLGGILGIYFYQLSPVSALAYPGVITLLLGVAILRNYRSKRSGKPIKSAD